MTRLKLKFVNEYRDRHGRIRRYFRRKGQRSIALPGLPGSIEFMAAYQAALAIVSPPPPSPKHVISGSLAAVAAGYFRSADFANLSPSSQQSYRVALKPILAAHGHRLVRELPKEAARHIIEGIGATRPGMANLTRSVLSKVIAYAIEIGIRADNPFAGLKPYRLGTYHTWTDAEIAQFERRWPLGTRGAARLRPAALYRPARRRRRQNASLRHRRRSDPRRPGQGPQRHDQRAPHPDPSGPRSSASSGAGSGDDASHHQHERPADAAAHEAYCRGRQGRWPTPPLCGAWIAQSCSSTTRRGRLDHETDRRREWAPLFVGN
jgi:hypothetical protein